MVGLLDLPLELREPILLDVIFDTIKQQPAQPPTLDEAVIGDYRCVQVFERGRNGSVLSFCSSLKRHAMSLLHVNQKIRNDVISFVLPGLAQHTNDAKLDIIIKKGPHPRPVSLWATWLSAPFPAYHLNTLHMQIRYFQDHVSWEHHPSRILRSVKDCDSWIDYGTADMLLRFVAEQTKAHGASIHERQRITITKGRLKSHRTIQKLVIDIPVDPNVPTSRGERVYCSGCLPNTTSTWDEANFCMVPTGKRTALILAKFLREKLLEIFHSVAESLEQPDYTTIRIIFERVGTIDLNVHGRLFESINLGQILAKSPRTEYRWGPFLAGGRADFFAWKRAAEDQRMAAGFEPVNHSMQEHELSGPLGLIGSILSRRVDSILVKDPGDDVPPARQRVPRDPVVFTGKAALIQEDGTRISGDATFHRPAMFVLGNMLFVDLGFDTFDTYGEVPLLSDSDSSFSGIRGEEVREEEIEIFKAEAIVISTYDFEETIISGDAIFYGSAKASTEQSSSCSYHDLFPKVNYFGGYDIWNPEF
ncbi:hypothetical protein DHEL01_v206396 [Diaporthe helianthi]|uniref:Uncharacterized protein n=1 Tax=Diaporthe helianthi TaxID=158607 RepID=A0A2P5HY83_DIAHE|nr:hypothetical protein DHEL01_v206396 [Diaporthe helianthi]